MAPPAPSLRTLVLPEGLDVVALVLVLVAGALYWVGVRRLAHRGRRWGRVRTAAFAGSLATVVVATQSGIARYDTTLFSAHVVQHVLLGMVAPVLVVLGAPLTLALQSGRPATTLALRRVLHHPAVRVLGHPLTAAVLFSGTLVVLYTTGLYEATLRSDVLHAWLHLHFMVVGYLWASAVLVVDPHPVRLPHAARLGLVAFTVPFHAILGVALLGSTTVIASSFYAEGGRTWGTSALADQRTGAGILWGVGELFSVLLGAAVLMSWMRHSEREGRRSDRRLAAVVAPELAGGPG